MRANKVRKDKIKKHPGKYVKWDKIVKASQLHASWVWGGLVCSVMRLSFWRRLAEDPLEQRRSQNRSERPREGCAGST